MAGGLAGDEAGKVRGPQAEVGHVKYRPSFRPLKKGLVPVKGSLAWSMAPSLINFCQ